MRRPCTHICRINRRGDPRCVSTIKLCQQSFLHGSILRLFGRIVSLRVDEGKCSEALAEYCTNQIAAAIFMEARDLRGGVESSVRPWREEQSRASQLLRPPKMAGGGRQRRTTAVRVRSVRRADYVSSTRRRCRGGTAATRF